MFEEKGMNSTPDDMVLLSIIGQGQVDALVGRLHRRHTEVAEGQGQGCRGGRQCKEVVETNRCL
jgi:hypothetical protein